MKNLFNFKHLPFTLFLLGSIMIHANLLATEQKDLDSILDDTLDEVASSTKAIPAATQASQITAVSPAQAPAPSQQGMGGITQLQAVLGESAAANNNQGNWFAETLSKGLDATGRAFTKTIGGLVTIMNDAQKEKAAQLERDRIKSAELEIAINQIKQGVNPHLIKYEYNHKTEAQLLAEKTALDQRIAESSKINYEEEGVALLKQGTQTFTDVQKIKAQGEQETDKAVAVANADAKASMAKFKEFMKPENLKKVALYGTLLAGGIAAAYYGGSLIYDYAKMHMGKPTLVRESSRNGLLNEAKASISSTLFGIRPPVADMKSLVFAPDIQELVFTLADDVKQCHDLGLPYQNALLYGPPGTGKTEFARLLAQYSGLDYAILSGADFSQFKDGEGITELHKLFEWAKTSKKGLLIFIDEADACLRDRATLDKEGVNLVNAFLSHTGASSTDFMIVMATNYENELDAAVRSRIHKKVMFDVPATSERAKIIQLKFGKYIINSQHTFKQNGKTITAKLRVDPEVNAEYFEGIVKVTEGFSGRDLDQLVAEIRLRAYRSGKFLVTKEICDNAVTRKIAEINKDKETTRMQRERLVKKSGSAANA